MVGSWIIYHLIKNVKTRKVMIKHILLYHEYSADFGGKNIGNTPCYITNIQHISAGKIPATKYFYAQVVYSKL